MKASRSDKPLTSFVREIGLADLGATQALARRLAPHLRMGDVICLKGDLGAGKTAFARALIQSFMLDEEVPSPTFTLIQSYEAGPFTIIHADLYRLESPDDVWELGWEDAINEAVVLVEWPERLASSQLPADRLEIQFLMEDEGQLNGGNARRACLTGLGAWARRLAQIGEGA